MSKKPQAFLYFTTKTNLTMQFRIQLNTIIQALLEYEYSYEFRGIEDCQKFDPIFQGEEFRKSQVCLSTIRINLRKGDYKTVEQGLNAIQMIWETNKAFHHQKSWIYELIVRCEQKYHVAIGQYLPSIHFQVKYIKLQSEEQVCQVCQATQNTENVEQANYSADDKQDLVVQEQTIYVNQGQAQEIWQKYLEEEKINNLRKNLLLKVYKCTKAQVLMVINIINSHSPLAIKFDKQGRQMIDIYMIQEELVRKILQLLDDPKFKQKRKKIKALNLDYVRPKPIEMKPQKKARMI